MNLWRKWIEKLKARERARGYACDRCGAELFDYPEHRLCQACEDFLEETGNPFCDKCGRKTCTSGVCLGCKSYLPRFTKGFSTLVYRGEASVLVNRMKNGNPRLALYFGERAADYFAQTMPAQQLLVLPVPTTAARKKHRGYNQAEILAESVCERLKQRGFDAALAREVLVQTRELSKQKELGFTARAQNVRGAFHLQKRKILHGANVLLVDDILTTGATGSEIARLLKGAGANAVYFLTVAATPEENA